MRRIQVHPTTKELINSAAELFISIGSVAIQENNHFSVVLSGGSTPQPLYRLLAQDDMRHKLDWNKIHFFWGDERAVPPDHPESNFRQASQDLLTPLQILPENIHRMRGELDPHQAAREYQEEILGWFQDSPPHFDLILLGMGSDGHTASLFPETEVVSKKRSAPDRWVAANWVPKLDAWRITFTPELINAAAAIVFLVSGPSKADPLCQVLEGPHQPELFPSQLINPSNGSMTWLVDQTAADQLGGQLV